MESATKVRQRQKKRYIKCFHRQIIIMGTFKVPARLLVTPSSCYCYSRADQTLTMRYYTAICQFIRHFHFTFHPKRRRRRRLRAANPEKCPKKKWWLCVVSSTIVKWNEPTWEVKESLSWRLRRVRRVSWVYLAFINNVCYGELSLAPSNDVIETHV